MQKDFKKCLFTFLCDKSIEGILFPRIIYFLQLSFANFSSFLPFTDAQTSGVWRLWFFVHSAPGGYRPQELDYTSEQVSLSYPYVELM